LILEIDNRAKEIAIDTGITTSPRNDFDYLKQWIEKPLITKINLDINLINKWKSQFNDAKYESIS
jgi:hypothetical protein